MTSYIIVHTKHFGCYDNSYYEERKVGKRVKPVVTINPPKIFLFDRIDQAKEFFDEYINDVDVLDERCTKGKEINHVDYCDCGIVELDEEDGQPIFFYNHRNQIFLLEKGPETFVTSHDLKIHLSNMNLTNSFIKRAKTLSTEQKLRYIELGRRCKKYLEPNSNGKDPLCQPCYSDPEDAKNDTDNEN